MKKENTPVVFPNYPTEELLTPKPEEEFIDPIVAKAEVESCKLTKFFEDVKGNLPEFSREDLDIIVSLKGGDKVEVTWISRSKNGIRYLKAISDYLSTLLPNKSEDNKIKGIEKK